MRWLTLALLAACDADTRPTPDAPSPLAERTCSEESTLALLNDPGTTAQTLRELGLRSSAAYHLMQIRSGTDGVHGTSDDVVFSSIDAVDAVPYVGPATLEVLEDWAEAACEAVPERHLPSAHELPRRMGQMT